MTLLFAVESPSFAASMLNNEGINFDGSNRLKNEFVYLDFLGKGGFGDVVLARLVLCKLFSSLFLQLECSVSVF